MADYYAVLQRTLSGFAEPKPELRAKLYERARATIEKQLQGRTPPVTGDALVAEMDKLERAIVDTENDYIPVTSEPMAEQASPVPEPTPAAPVDPVFDDTSPIPINPIPSGPVEPVFEAVPAPDTLAPEQIPEPAPVIDLAIEIPIPPETSSIPVDDAHILQPEPAPITSEGLAQAEETPVTQPPSDPVEQWAQEFLAHKPDTHTDSQTMEEPVAAIPEVQPLPELEIPTPPPTPELVIPPPAAEFVPQVADPHPVIDPAMDDSLGIPPAPGYTARASRRGRNRGYFKWIVVLFILALLGAAGYFAWQSRDAIVDRFGLHSWFDDPTRPKPVKTITITPDPIDSSQQEPAPEPKAEERLADDTTAASAELPAVKSDTPTAVKPAAVGTRPQIAQNAVLYEEGGASADNSVDAGRVLWSVVQEEPSAGLPKEPAIRARIEIPSRKLVLIMTIKRNGDKSVPASHLIELVYALPDDFSGGGIGQVRSLVFKDKEQGKGKALVGVPIQVSNGIFMVALNNLESAEKQNDNLMRERRWIDIPMQYRTGRRAFITLEKGAPGDKVFQEVFAAWSGA